MEEICYELLHIKVLNFNRYMKYRLPNAERVLKVSFTCSADVFYCLYWRLNKA